MASLRTVRGPLAASALVVAAIAGTLLTPDLLAQQQPTFRSGVDLMSADVVVVDKSGAPVPSLTAEDFSVTLGKKPRRVVAAEFVGSARTQRAPALRAAPAASSNRRTIAPRTLMFLIDTYQIPSGGGRVAMKGIGEYLDQLATEDRVGIITLTESRVAPTVDRAPVRDAVDRLVGTSGRLRDKEMTFGEAEAIFSHDTKAQQAYWSRIADQGPAMPGDRTCAPPQGFQSITTVSAVCAGQAELTLERVRLETRRVLGRLTAIADAMATIPDPKAIVLVSGGLFSDAQLHDDFVAFGAVAEQTHVAVSAMLIEADGSGGGGSSADTRRLDSQAGFGGLVDLTTMARGTAHRVATTSAPALARLDKEMSGYYVVSFERDASDVPGQRIELEVHTRRPDVTVISRKGLTPGRTIAGPATEKAGADLKGGIAALLKSPTAVTQVPIAIDAFAMPASATGSDARIILALEVGRDPGAVAALGFQFADASGKVIGDGYEAPAKLQPIAPGRSGFVTAVSATAGRFIVRVGTIDAKGERGSLQHAFEVMPWPQASIRLSDLMFGAVDGGDFAPGAGPSADGRLAMRLIVRDNTQKFDAVKVHLVVLRAADATPVDEADIPLQQTPDPLRRFADASVPIDAYPPGEYVVSMIVTGAGGEVGRRQRAFIR